MIDPLVSACHVGDCRELLAQLPEQSVQCCVTSPPYWGLRDYGVDGQLGLEATPDEYVTNMVEVFRSVRPVLRDDGTLWLNLGDSYFGIGSGPQRESRGNVTGEAANGERPGACNAKAHGAWPKSVGLKPKDLVGIPWRVAFALQQDGWYLRSDIVWHKPNPMPESVADRPTKSHEYLFLLSKSERYFYDAAAIAERAVYAGEQLGIVRGSKRRALAMGVAPSGNEKPGADADIAETRNKRSVWTIATQPYDGAHFATMPPDLVKPCVLAGSKTGDVVLDPFFGSGTVGMVAESLGRRWIGFELNPEYAKLSAQRTAQRGLAI